MFPSKKEVDDLDTMVNQTIDIGFAEKAYYEPKREDICRFTYHTPCMCFRAAPEAVTDVNIVHEMIVLYW